MSFKSAVLVAAALAIAAPTLVPAFATGSRLNPDHPRRNKAEEPLWRYQVGKEQIGPMTTDELIKAAEDGDVKADTQVYHPDAGWRLASAVPELKGALR